jgi:hypothetical protein
MSDYLSTGEAPLLFLRLTDMGTFPARYRPLPITPSTRYKEREGKKKETFALDAEIDRTNRRLFDDEESLTFCGEDGRVHTL